MICASFRICLLACRMITQHDKNLFLHYSIVCLEIPDVLENLGKISTRQTEIRPEISNVRPTPVSLKEMKHFIETRLLRVISLLKFKIQFLFKNCPLGTENEKKIP